MKSFQKTTDKQYYLDCISRLTLQSKAGWGKMDAPQMMKHLSDLLQLATGRKMLPSNKLLSFLLGRLLKHRIVHTEKPLSKGLGNEKLPPNEGFAQEKSSLLQAVQQFEAVHLSQVPLPLFGKMSDAEWDKFLVKQFDHHLIQFGV